MPPVPRATRGGPAPRGGGRRPPRPVADGTGSSRTRRRAPRARPTTPCRTADTAVARAPRAQPATPCPSRDAVPRRRYGCRACAPRACASRARPVRHRAAGRRRPGALPARGPSSRRAGVAHSEFCRGRRWRPPAEGRSAGRRRGPVRDEHAGAAGVVARAPGPASRSPGPTSCSPGPPSRSLGPASRVRRVRRRAARRGRRRRDRARLVAVRPPGPALVRTCASRGWAQVPPRGRGPRGARRRSRPCGGKLHAWSGAGYAASDRPACYGRSPI